MEIIPIKTRIFREKESLFEFLKNYLPTLIEGDVVAVTSKIVALSQGRTAVDSDKTKIFKRESKEMIKTRWCYLAQKDGDWLPNAGVDESNANGRIILLPDNSYQVAINIRSSLKHFYRLKRLGVILTDTRSRPLRAGVTGVALAYAGFIGLGDYRGKTDLFGRKLKYTQSNLADALATAAVVTMGEGQERIPLAVIRNAPIKYASRRPEPDILFINPRQDLYGLLFQKRASRLPRDR